MVPCHFMEDAVQCVPHPNVNLRLARVRQAFQTELFMGKALLKAHLNKIDTPNTHCVFPSQNPITDGKVSRRLDSGTKLKSQTFFLRKSENWP